MDKDLANIILACDVNLDTRVAKAIKSNMFSEIVVTLPEEPISLQAIGGTILASDNRELRILRTINPFKAISNFLRNGKLLSMSSLSNKVSKKS